MFVDHLLGDLGKRQSTRLLHAGPDGTRGRAVGLDDLGRRRLGDRRPVHHSYAVPVDGHTLRAQGGPVAMGGADQADDFGRLAGLLDDLAAQSIGGGLAEVGAAAGQVPAADAWDIRARSG